MENIIYTKCCVSSTDKFKIIRDQPEKSHDENDSFLLIECLTLYTKFCVKETVFDIILG